MSELSHEVELVLHGRMSDENIRVISELVDFMKFKEDQALWLAIDNGEMEEMSQAEMEEIARIKTEAEYSSIDTVIARLNREDTEHV